MMLRRVVFILAVVLAMTPWASAPVALGVGVVLALVNLTAYEKESKKYSRLIIQWCIVLLGFSIDLRQVAAAGASGIVFAAGTIVATFGLGWVLGRMLKTEAKVTTLLCSGTAICGGSAIAATGSVIRASDAQMSVALAAVFSLNAIALWVFPPIGHALGMSQSQFGAWAAVAIHDMSSVVGAGKAYGDEALRVATVIKLSRVLWIVPVSLLAAWMVGKEAGGAGTGGAGTAAKEMSLGQKLGKVVPWFIGLFLAASLVRTLVPAVSAAVVDWHWAGDSLKSAADVLKAIAKQGMVVALLLIGSGLSKKALLSVGWRPFVLAVVLWVFISVAALVVVRGAMG